MLETVTFEQSQTHISSMSFIRRKRPHLSSTRMNQIEAQGLAYLCFAEDNSWFQGNINTDDESNYSLYGERVSSATVKEEPNNNEIKVEDAKSPECYRATLIDHFTGLTYQLPRVNVNQNVILSEGPADNGSLLFCSDGQINFKVENVFKGQKADMIIQRYLGSATLLERKCVVYSGAMNIVFNEVIDKGRSWCL